METNNNNNNNNNNDKRKASLEDSSQEKENDCVSNGFPAGLRVLVVDDDRTCLLILEKMLQSCLYKDMHNTGIKGGSVLDYNYQIRIETTMDVTKCGKAKDALSMLREDKNRFDIVVSDLHMADMDGFKLLEIAEFEMDLPVVMMSSDDDHEVVLKGVLHGACDYLIKPIRMEALKFIWQHVVRKKKNTAKESEQLRSLENGKQLLKKSDSDDDKVMGNGGNTRSSKRRKHGEDDSEASDPAPTGKKRMIWTKELNDKFVRAVNHLGHQNAVPLKILECLQKMNVHGITREHVASHLQKYRMHLRKLDDIPQPGKGNFVPSTITGTSIFCQSGTLDSCNLQQFDATTNQFPLPRLTTLQASGPATLSSIRLPFDSQRRLFHSRMVESNYHNNTKSSTNDYPVNNNFGIGPSCKNVSSFDIPSLGKEYEYGNLGNVAQSSQSLSVADSFDDSYDNNGDITPQLIYEPSLFLQHFDPNEIFPVPFLQQGIAPVVIKYNSATKSDK